MLAHSLSLLVVLGYAMCLNYNILEPYANSKFYPTANAQIKWRLDNVSLPFPNPDIRIHLYNEKQKFLMEIDSFVGNTGLYEWTIPSDLMYSAHYQGLRVCIDSVTPGDIEGCSEVFYLQSYLEEPRQLDLSVEGIEAATVYVEEELSTKFSKLSSFPELPWGVNFEMHVPSKGAEAHVGKSVTLARNVSFGNSYEGNVKLKVPTLEQWGNIPKDKNAGDDTFDAELFAYGYNTKKGSLVYGSLPVRVAYQIPLKLRFISVDSTTVWETEKVQSIVMGLCAQDDDSVVRNRDIRLSMWFVNDKNEKVGDVLVNKEVFRHEMTSGVFSIKFTLKNDSIVWKALESASSFSGDDQKVFTQEVKVADKKVRLVYNAEYNVNINNGKSHDRWIKLEGHSDQFFLKFNQKQKSSAGHLAPSVVSYAMFHAFGFPTKLAVKTTAFISSVAAIHALNYNFQYRKLNCHFWNSPAASEHEINCPSKIRSLAKTSIKSTVSIETSVEFSIRTGLFGFRKAETQVAVSKGTGFILSKDKGLVVTNAHVIQDIVGQKEGQFELSIKLWDGSWFEGKVVAFDAWSDLAVLQIQGYDEKYIDFDVEEVKFGNSDTVEIGDWLYTFGDPLGLGHSLTSGIASSLHRQNADVDMSGRMDSRLEYIQTNFSGLDYGNSGGPVFNLKGELVAILCIKAATGGIGFALTSNSTRALIDQLVQRGKVIRPWLGLRLVSVTKAVRQTLKLPETVPRGVLVTDVFKESPAYKAQLKEGDVIHRLNGQPIDNTNDVFALIKYSPEPFIVSVVRQVDSQWKEYELQVLPEELDLFHQARIPLNSGGIDEYEDYISSLRPDQQSKIRFLERSK